VRRPTRPVPEVPRSRNQSPRKFDTVFNIRQIIANQNKQSAEILGETEDNILNEIPSTNRGRENSQFKPRPRQRPEPSLETSTIPVNRAPSRFGAVNEKPSQNNPIQFKSKPEYEYEYYYEYLDDEPNRDYDLVPLANKVQVLQDGSLQCLDVGVFAHPSSCNKFINCYNPGTGIQGSIYQCPSYLAFDPVGGRCNWVKEIVCKNA